MTLEAPFADKISDTGRSFLLAAPENMSTTAYRPGHFPSLDCYLTVCHGFVNIYIMSLPSQVMLLVAGDSS